MPVLEHQHIDFCALGKGPDPGLPLSTVMRALDRGGAGGRLRPGHRPLDKGATYRPTQERAIPAAPAQGGRLQPRVVGPRFVKDKQETGFPAGLVSGALRSFQQRSKCVLGLSTMSGEHTEPRGHPGRHGVHEAGTLQVLSPPSPSPGDR